ncbi:OsmC family peroxiredoxin [Propionibacteriaceae bacterium G57]|uniref:OsmC family peroxiredoxin n=1 Tax=Aestuariimicrobium sp. G57 TaxID=3418485 RepID=UPI003DA6FF45
MPTPINNSASAVWKGDLATGSGEVHLDTSGSGTFPTGWKSRAVESGSSTTPEELIAAAHSTCYSMAFSHALSGAGYTVNQLDTKAVVTFVAGSGITKIALDVTGDVEGISEEDFLRMADDAKTGCPVSQALAAVPEITLEARLA